MRAFKTSRSGARNRPAHSPAAKRRRFAGALKFGQRAPGRGDDFERAQYPLAVARAQPRRGKGVEFGEPGVQARRRLAFGLGAHISADRFRHARNVGEAFGQRAEIEPGAADEQERPGASLRFSENFARALEPAPDREILGAVDLAEQPVRRLPLFGLARARREHPQIAIDLHRVGVDDDAAEPLGESKRDGRLAARRRACNEKRATSSPPPPCSNRRAHEFEFSRAENQSSMWLTMPSASLGSNQVDFGGMIAPASATAMRSRISVG